MTTDMALLEIVKIARLSHAGKHGQNIKAILAAYGAAQYEAGAAQMRERAASFTRDSVSGDTQYWTRERKLLGIVSEKLRALPLREKD